MSVRSVVGAALFLVAAGAIPACAMLAPRDGQPVAILHRAGDSPAAAGAVAAAGGLLLDMPGRHVTLARSADSGFAGRIQARGPWLVLDASALQACMGAGRRAAVSIGFRQAVS